MPNRAPVVLLSDRVLRPFLNAAARQYEAITPDEPRPCFAVLLGHTVDGAHIVERVEFGRNARTTNPAAREEFDLVVVPTFGAAYENPVRAWWFDPGDLLRISRTADAMGQEILGSIHMHPDWHRLGPEAARAHPLCEEPTPMDEYMFSASGWPVNVVCYVERLHGRLYHTLAAWQPDCVQIPVRVLSLSHKESA
ncbi:hypothetical protein LWC34_18260 [Kibdelosporangium philippinense]|uniref:JAB domain-containing protein n=2 Tax=Kibdelosporangium philippinense TaxID=211113 RepID=A0ABS8ZFZ5_9PSEU|nr:hypothetical protein [Kibdelosporangium philippinense]MCE7004752.1 hypothetical protein [Kibdelosporangium philippinense]